MDVAREVNINTLTYYLNLQCAPPAPPAAPARTAPAPKGVQAV
jgi:hypothetical protein